ncbi:MAG: hypothetical protein FWG68_02525 [Defluviitaleaceae bacterium]|nr:hypothetical protein [Defluviitaleaceae bacterium]
MPLPKFKSLCDKNQPIIVSDDGKNSPKHTAFNVSKPPAYVTQYKIDGCVIKSGLRCDFLVMNEDKRTAYLIELKNSDLSHAAEQLINTKILLEDELEGYKLHFRAVLSKVVTAETRSTSVKKLMKKSKGQFKYKTKTMEEKI